jgi:hypothetical protein
MINWIRLIEAGGHEFSITKNIESNQVFIQTYTKRARKPIFVYAIIDCEGKQDMEEQFRLIDEDYCITILAEADGQITSSLN